MSGRKYSQFRLQQERAEKLRLVQEIVQTSCEAEALKKRLAEVLKAASPGLRETFQRETQAAEAWLAQAQWPAPQRFSMESDLASLRETQDQLKAAVSEGRRLHQALVTAYTEKADALGKQLSQRLVETEQLYFSRQQLLRLWVQSGQVRAWEEALGNARRLVEQQRYTEAEDTLAKLRGELEEKGRWAETQEDKHQKRLYVLKALRHVCAQMGFVELEEPHPEREEDRGSRIVYTVDTLDRGTIKFALSLDEVSSFSEIEDAHCFEDFDRLSEFLQNEFGVQTHFESQEGKKRPQLKHVEKKALPRTQPRAKSKN